MRSDEKLLKHDKKYKLGFLENYKRMNVAISRAKEMLLIVGNVNILKRDKNWNKFLEYSEQNDCIDLYTYKSG